MNYAKVYFQLIEKRKHEKPTNYSEKHHIIPRCMGGSDDSANIVRLTAKEHYIAHLLLTKMYNYGTIEYFKLVKAFMMMVNCSSGVHDRHVTSNTYCKLREDFATAMSISQKGKNNTQYGTMWIYSNVERTSKKINKAAHIPDGWLRGRVVDFSYLDRTCERCNVHLGITNKKTLKKVCQRCKLYDADKVRQKYILLYDQYLNSGCKTASAFSDIVGISVVSLTQNWHKYIDGYTNIYH